jgi:hypothetical protein
VDAGTEGVLVSLLKRLDKLVAVVSLLLDLLEDLVEHVGVDEAGRAELVEDDDGAGGKEGTAGTSDVDSTRRPRLLLGEGEDAQ